MNLSSPLDVAFAAGALIAVALKFLAPVVHYAAAHM